MTTYADGGLTATNLYVSGTAYINRMSNSQAASACTSPTTLRKKPAAELVPTHARAAEAVARLQSFNRPSY